MTRKSAAVFCMPEQGHFKRLLPLIAGLSGAGIETHVFTDLRYRAAVERAGGRFSDVFAGRPLEAADATSLPVPCRYVSFAAHHADSMLRELAPLRPDLVVHDTFAVIGVVAANALALPRVAVCSGHNAAPLPTVEALRRDGRDAATARIRPLSDALLALDDRYLREAAGNIVPEEADA